MVEIVYHMFVAFCCWLLQVPPKLLHFTFILTGLTGHSAIDYYMRSLPMVDWKSTNQQFHKKPTNVQLVIHQDGEIEGGKISEIWIEAGKKEETR